jgi:hypothetical protein
MLTEADRNYVEANFIPLDRAAHGHGDDPPTIRELIAAARLPCPSRRTLVARPADLGHAEAIPRPPRRFG